MIFQISRLPSVARYDKSKSLIRQGKPFDIFVLKMHIEVPWLLTTAENHTRQMLKNACRSGMATPVSGCFKNVRSGL